MADLLIKRLEEEIAKQRFNYKSLSLAAGLGETTVRDIITGRARNPRRDTLQKIARILGKPLSYFITEDMPMVLVTDTGNRSPLSRSFRERDGTSGRDFVEALPESGYRDIAAVRLRGDTMLPYLPEGTVLYYNERKETGFDDWLGKLCVAQVRNGAPGVYILKAGTLYGRYHLESYNAKTQENADIEWCARVVFVKLS